MNYGKDFYQAYNRQFAGDKLSSEIVRLANQYIKGKVLDVGAGSGAMIKAIKRLNYTNFPIKQGKIDEVYGIDICPTNDDIIETGIDKIPFPDWHFDCVTCTATLEHLGDPVLTKGLSEVYRVLKSGGYFIITVPYNEILGDNNESTILCPNCNKYFHRWGHVQSFGEHDIMNLLILYGFKYIRNDVIPLGFMASHKYLKYLVPWINNMPLVRYEQRSIFMVAQKV